MPHLVPGHLQSPVRPRRPLAQERSLASSLVPNRDVGVQVLGDLKPGRVTYSAGVMNGVPDGTSSTTDDDSNGDDSSSPAHASTTSEVETARFIFITCDLYPFAFTL